MNNKAPNDSRFLDLLQRWLRGDFRRADEQALQKLVSGDEFRSEALEGYQLLPGEDHQAKLESLQERLRSRVPGARRVAIWPRLVSIAAVLTLLVLALWFVPVLFREAPGDIAQQSPAVMQDTCVSVAASPAEPEEPAFVPPPQVAPLAQSKKMPAPVSSGSDIASAGATPAADELKEAGGDGQPAPLASAPQAVAPPVGAVTQEESAFRKSDPLPAVAKSRETIALPPGRPAADPAALGGQPVIGWAAFNDYLRRNARLTPEARNNNISGPVKLEFSIDDAGKPTDFTILQPLGFGCDEKAVELVRSQQWLPGAGGRTQVEVWFRR